MNRLWAIVIVEKTKQKKDGNLVKNSNEKKIFRENNI